MSGELTESSLEYISNTPLEKRKMLGQYMTPKAIRDIAIENLSISDGDKVLDPAVGTGELLLSVRNSNPNVSLYGWDIDEEILKTARINLGQEALLECLNGLWVNGKDGFFDAAIVNPPYFELKPSLREKEAFGEIIKGRANIYAFFIKKVVELVKENGYMAFIVPPSMNNGSYFDLLRDYIIKNAEIKFIKVISDSSLFIEAQTSVQIIILQKKSRPNINESYVIDLKKTTNSPVQRYIFSDQSKNIISLWKDKISIYNLGYDVITGPLVWNTFAASLSPNKITDKYLPVYYSKDIASNGTIGFNSSMDKRRYMDSSIKTCLQGESIIVNRIVGGVGSGNIKAAIVSGSYYAENHVNVIIPRKDAKQLISLKALHQKLIEDTSIAGYLQSFTGNTQLSASELKYFIPIRLK